MSKEADLKEKFKPYAQSNINRKEFSEKYPIEEMRKIGFKKLIELSKEDNAIECVKIAQAYADEVNKELIAKIELLEACREYDASGENRPDGYIVPNHYTGQRIDEMNKPLNK